MIQKNEELQRSMEGLKDDATMDIDMDKNVDDLTLDDLGEVDPKQQQITPDQMEKMIKYFNGKINHIKKQENKLIKRRKRNTASKKSRKKNRSK